LDASSDEEDKEAAPTRPGPKASGQELNLSIYSAAAGPFKALLACVGQAPGARYLFYHAATVSIQLCMLVESACVLCSKSQPVTHNTTILVLPLLVDVYSAACVSSVFRSCVLLLINLLLLYRFVCRSRCRHTYIVWCCSAFRHACMSLQANNLVKKQHMCHPQQKSPCNCLCRGTGDTRASALCQCRRPSSAAQHWSVLCSSYTGVPPPGRSTSSHWAT